MCFGWKGFPPIESVEVWPWCRMASRRNRKGWIEQRGWGINGSNTGRAVYELWMDR